MHKLSDTVNRKFIDSIDIDEWEIETDTGWEEISSINKTIEYQEWVVETYSGLKLISADNHILFNENMEEIFTKDCVPDETKLTTKYGIDIVKSVTRTDKFSNMYDLSVNSYNHRYYTDGFLSHNTTTAAAVILHYILFNSDKLVALLANKGDAAREILDRIKTSYENLPEFLQQGVKEWNKGSIVLENGSKIIAAATTSSSVRGRSVSFLYIDETAFIENWDDFFASVFPTISSGETTKILLTSTPKGLNHFHKLCTHAQLEYEDKDWNGYEYVEVPWNKVPGRGEKWYQETISSMNYDYEKFEQEFNCAFQGSSGTLINGTTLKSLVSRVPISSMAGMKQYVSPLPNHNYTMICDVSRGKGLDYSAFSVIDITKMPYQQVCAYKSNLITPLDYAAEIFKVSKLYNNAAILVEINDIGGQVADSLYHDYESENLISTENAGPRGKRISVGNANAELGIRTTKTVKAVGCSILKLLVEQHQLIINDHDTIFELSRFSKKANSYEAESGCHDDLVMGLVLFAWLSDQQYFKELTDINTLLKLREKSDEDIENELMPFGFSSDMYDTDVEPEIIDLTNIDDLPHNYRTLLNGF